MGNPRPSSRGSDGPSVPASTVARLQDCAEHGAARLTDTNYAILFDVDMNADGGVDKAKVRESLIHDGEMVSCMADALDGMSLPGIVTPLRDSGVIVGDRVTPEGRASVGHPAAAAAAAGAAVNLIPIVLVAGGVTILVAVTAHIAEEVVEAIAAAGRRRDVERRCQALLDECLENQRQPKEEAEIYGNKKDCLGCYGECKNEKRWPEERCPRAN